jgi:hypothetical protein
MLFMKIDVAKTKALTEPAHALLFAELPTPNKQALK